MLDFSQFKQLKDLNDLKSHQSTKLIILPEDLKEQISYKSLLSEATWSDLNGRVDVLHIFNDESAYLGHFNELDLIDIEEMSNVVMVYFDNDEFEESIITFENGYALRKYLSYKDQISSSTVYLELNDQMIDELVAKTLEAQIKFYDQKIAKAKLDIKLATEALKEYEELKEELMNESK